MPGLLDVDESIAGVDETCEVCVHRLRPGVVLTCSNRESEFYCQPVHPLGWCDKFTPRGARAGDGE